MKREYFLISLFFLVCAIFFYLFYQIMLPFFAPILWASVFVILFYPAYERLLVRVKSKGLAALISCVIIVVLIIGPVAYLFTALAFEAAEAVSEVNTLYQSGKLNEMFALQLPWLESIQEKLGQYVDMSKFNADDMARDTIDKVGKLLMNQTTWLVANATKTVFLFVLMIFTTYYFFKEGSYLIHKVKRLMPFSEQQVEESFGQLHDIIQATIYGGVVIALLQGVLGGILFWLVDISSPIFWGGIMAFLSIIPFVGAFIIYIPAGFILMLGGHFVQGIIVITVGTLIISQIDNVLRPLLIAGKASLHPLILFFAILGGIPLFGLLGVVIGPMVAAVFLTLLKVFEFKLHPTEEELPESS